jgi:hypothetical protein
MICPMENGDHAELLALTAQQLEEPQVVRLQEHLGACSRCREFVARQQAVWQALDAWEAPAITSDFDRRLFRRIEQRPSWRDRYWAFQHWVPIAAAACLIVVAGWVSSRPARVAPLPQTQAAQLQSLQPEQVEHVLDDMQMLSDFTKAARSDAGEL